MFGFKGGCLCSSMLLNTLLRRKRRVGSAYLKSFFRLKKRAVCVDNRPAFTYLDEVPTMLAGFALTRSRWFTPFFLRRSMVL